MPPRLLLPWRRPPPLHLAPRRTFFDALAGPSRFTASRVLPYAPRAVYDVVADIDAYRAYLPYCLGSAVTARDAATGAPTEADLRVGWGAYDETFRSRVCCVPERLEVSADASQNPLFQTLVARWRIRELGAEEGERERMGAGEAGRVGEGGASGVEGRSEVVLGIEFAFTNPLYGALSQAVAPKVAGVMVEAFEKRARELLEKKKLEGAR